MTLIDLLVAEFEHETGTTRPHLERLPNDRLVSGIYGPTADQAS